MSYSESQPKSATYSDNQSKTVAILNPKIDIPKLMNAVGHTTQGLSFKVSKNLNLLEYKFNADWSQPASISLFPYILLEAKNNNQLKTLHRAVSDTQILHNVFTETMLGSSADQQMEQTLIANPDDLIYFCIVLFGTAEELTPLTRKFSVFKG